MKFHLIITVVILIVLTCMYNNLAIDTKPELKNNVLNFGYRVNFKYEGVLSHSFDRFHVVTKFEMPKVKDLKLMIFTFDLTYKHLNNPKSYIHFYLKHCQKIAPYVKFFQKQIEYYNKTAYNILEKEIGLILLTYCCITFYRLTSILVTSLLNGTMKV